MAGAPPGRLRERDRERPRDCRDRAPRATSWFSRDEDTLAIVSGVVFYLRARRVDEENVSPRPFLVGGAFYALFIAVVLWHVYVTGLSGVSTH